MEIDSIQLDDKVDVQGHAEKKHVLAENIPRSHPDLRRLEIRDETSETRWRIEGNFWPRRPQ
jgi:hypothetical protein